jgi:hypothetical protein
MGKMEQAFKAEIVRLARRERRATCLPLAREVRQLRRLVSELRRTSWAPLLRGMFNVTGLGTPDPQGKSRKWPLRAALLLLGCRERRQRALYLPEAAPCGCLPLRRIHLDNQTAACSPRPSDPRSFALASVSVAGGAGGGAALHRTGKTVAECVHRGVQREAAGRVLKWSIFDTLWNDRRAKCCRRRPAARWVRRPAARNRSIQGKATSLRTRHPSALRPRTARCRPRPRRGTSP